MKDATIGSKTRLRSLGKTIKKGGSKILKPTPKKPEGPKGPKDTWTPGTKDTGKGGKSLKDIFEHFKGKLPKPKPQPGSPRPLPFEPYLPQKPGAGTPRPLPFPIPSEPKPGGDSRRPLPAPMPPIGINGSKPPFEPYLPQQPGKPHHNLPMTPFEPKPINNDSRQPLDFPVPSRIDAQNGAALPSGIIA